MHITHVITGLNVGGAERALHTLLTGGLEERFRNRVVSLMGEGHYGPRLREAGIPVACLEMAPGCPSPQALLRLRSMVTSERPDILQGWMYHGNLFAALARCMGHRHARLCWNVRTSLESVADMSFSTRFGLHAGRLWSARADHIIYNSARSRVQHEAFGFAAARASVLPNAFDTRIWSPSLCKRKKIRAEFGCSSETPLIGFVGRNDLMKDPMNLYRALHQVFGVNRNVRAVVIGRGLEEAAPPDLPRDRVLFLGERNDVPNFMPALDILCLSSRVEGFPNVVGEAMACGVPCVTTDVGDAAEIVGDTGWTAPPRNSAALAERLLIALSIPQEALRRRGEAARRRIEQRYSLHSVVNQYGSLYSSLGKVLP